MYRLFHFVIASAVAMATAGAQVQPSQKTSAVERLAPGLFRIGQIRVDTARREISVPGQANDAQILEFVANTNVASRPTKVR